MAMLNRELTSVITELQAQFSDTAAGAERQTADPAAALALFEKIRPMLENINPEVTALLAEIRAIQGTEELARQIENYEFDSAAITLAALIRQWEEVNHE